MTGWVADKKMTLETTQIVPLTLREDGSIRVKNTRLLIDIIIGAYERGECPEEIFDSFPSAEYTVADIYSIIAYYLTHKPQMKKYLTERKREAEEVRKQIEATPGYQKRKGALRGKILQRYEKK